MVYYKLPHGLPLEAVLANRRGKAPDGHHQFVSKDGLPVGYTAASLAKGGDWAGWYGGMASAVAADDGERLSHPRGGILVSGVDRPCPAGCGDQIAELTRHAWVCYTCWEAGTFEWDTGLPVRRAPHSNPEADAAAAA